MARTQTKSDDAFGSKIRARTNLYVDFDLAFIANPNTGDVSKKTDIEAIKQSVKNLILTMKGERPFQPYLGSNVRHLLFENGDPFTAINLKKEIEFTIDNHEPRVDLIDVIVTEALDANRFKIQIRFALVSTGQQEDVDFYLERIK
tara:strand:+ start:8129 stop:8566 length:438 start_codon:yes stop_codon:yes gene_type:complete